MTKKEFIKSRFDVKELRKAGFWINGERTYEQYEKRICAFFGLKSIFMYEYIGEMPRKPLKADLKTFSDN